MCHYITAVLPRTADIEKLGAIMTAHHRKLELLANRSIEEQLLAGERYFLTTATECDCGTELGFAARTRQSVELNLDAQVEKLKRKGWGAAKIERWLQERMKSTDAGGECDTQPWHRNGNWLSLIEDVLRNRATSYFGLLLHWYSGPLSGRIALKGREEICKAEDRLQALGLMCEDHLYVFR